MHHNHGALHLALLGHLPPCFERRPHHRGQAFSLTLSTPTPLRLNLHNCVATLDMEGTVYVRYPTVERDKNGLLVGPARTIWDDMRPNKKVALADFEELRIRRVPADDALDDDDDDVTRSPFSRIVPVRFRFISGRFTQTVKNRKLVIHRPEHWMADYRLSAFLSSART